MRCCAKNRRSTSDTMDRPSLPGFPEGCAQGRQISRRPEMRKNVTPITAQRRAMWKDDDHGEP
jgi:hypothetical protein